MARPQYKLRQICRFIRMDSLTANVDVATKLTGQEKVPPLVEAEIAAEAYTRVAFDLWKNVTQVALSDEALKKVAHDILGLHVSDAAKELVRMENKKVAEEMPSATDQAAGRAWDAMTTPPTSDNNPFEDILTALDTLDGNGYPTNWAVMNAKVWKAFITNSYVKDLVHAGIARLGALDGDFSLPGYSNVRVLVDHAVTPDMSFYLLSDQAQALVRGEGPRRPGTGTRRWVITPISYASATAEARARRRDTGDIRRPQLVGLGAPIGRQRHGSRPVLKAVHIP